MATVGEDQTQDAHQRRKSPRRPESVYATPRHLPVHAIIGQASTESAHMRRLRGSTYITDADGSPCHVA